MKNNTFYNSFYEYAICYNFKEYTIGYESLIDMMMTYLSITYMAGQ